MKRWLLAVVLAYAAVQAWQLSYQSLVLIQQGPFAFFPPFGAKYATEWPWVVGHGWSACLLLSLGPLLLARRQFGLPRPWHARLGKFYLACAAVAIVTGLPLSARAEGGPAASASFFCLSAIWSWATWQALKAARSRQWARHERLVRFHYALAFSAVLLRIGLGTAAYLDIEMDRIAVGVAWASWQPAMLYGWVSGIFSRQTAAAAASTRAR